MKGNNKMNNKDRCNKCKFTTLCGHWFNVVLLYKDFYDYDLSPIEKCWVQSSENCELFEEKCK